MTARPFRLVVLPGERWAAEVASALAARIVAQPALRLCLASGDTPTPVYAALVEAERRGEVSLAAATLVALDEWLGLPPGDPARCDVRLRAELVDRLAARPAAFHAIAVDGPDAEAAAAGHDAAAGRIDLAVVGIGMNGHVGFNEPGCRPDDGTRVVRLAASSRAAATERYGAARVPTAGITIGLARLLGAGECWLLATGERKAAILRRALEDPEGPDSPASWLRRHPRLTVYADERAAGGLRRN